MEIITTACKEHCSGVSFPLPSPFSPFPWCQNKLLLFLSSVIPGQAQKELLEPDNGGFKQKNMPWNEGTSAAAT